MMCTGACNAIPLLNLATDENGVLSFPTGVYFNGRIKREEPKRIGAFGSPSPLLCRRWFTFEFPDNSEAWYDSVGKKWVSSSCLVDCRLSCNQPEPVSIPSYGNRTTTHLEWFIAWTLDDRRHTSDDVKARAGRMRVLADKVKRLADEYERIGVGYA